MNNVINAKASDAFAAGKVQSASATSFRDRVGLQPSGPRTPAKSPPAQTRIEAEVENPYQRHVDRFGSNLNRKTFTECVYPRRGNPVIIEAEEGRFLRKQQREWDRLNAALRGLTWENIHAEKKAAKTRLEKGRGSAVDSAFDKGNLREVRRGTKRALARLSEETRPTLIRIAKRVELLARQTLPELEAESLKLGISPGDAPLVRSVAAACWMPSKTMATTVHTPKVALRELGLSL